MADWYRFQAETFFTLYRPALKCPESMMRDILRICELVNLLLFVAACSSAASRILWTKLSKNSTSSGANSISSPVSGCALFPCSEPFLPLPPFVLLLVSCPACNAGGVSDSESLEERASSSDSLLDADSAYESSYSRSSPSEPSSASSGSEASRS
ncbi:hypothetical protein BZA05DRAFT_407268 [Tricharina praecox]|uniref:uncharacterized protein n=1 Tax=Tricharina praecox TaxID=43433 RepID=UPI00221FEFA2|nr:uncharacterized protein BZA05DRAFT_407268 [Tricharina praecox]KAI5845899.1 hypothetical protein BZA05DRAFT_407268 [Tricharina praecox]